VLGLFSSCRNWDLSSHPLTAGECAPPPLLVPGEGHTRLREERGVGGPNSDEGTDTVVL
jgi:hypothetical protein